MLIQDVFSRTGRDQRLEKVACQLPDHSLQVRALLLSRRLYGTSFDGSTEPSGSSHLSARAVHACQTSMSVYVVLVELVLGRHLPGMRFFLVKRVFCQGYQLFAFTACSTSSYTLFLAVPTPAPGSSVLNSYTGSRVLQSYGCWCHSYRHVSLHLYCLIGVARGFL
jgi:hypothetical protein